MNKELEQSSISLILQKTLWVQLPGNGPTGLLLLRVMQELWVWERCLFIHMPPDEQLRVLVLNSWCLKPF